MVSDIELSASLLCDQWYSTVNVEARCALLRLLHRTATPKPPQLESDTAQHRMHSACVALHNTAHSNIYFHIDRRIIACECYLEYHWYKIYLHLDHHFFDACNL